MAQRQSRTHTVNKTAEQAAINGIQNGQAKEEQKAEKKADEKFLGMSTATYVTAIENAAGFAKSALHLELAVGLSMFAQHGNTSLEAKRDLATVYAQAGYKCATPQDEDYKTVNRRINVAAEFFNWLGGKDQVTEWTVATSEMQSIQAIVRHLEDEFNFKGMNSVMAHIGKPVILKRDREKAAAKKAAPAILVAEAMPDEEYNNLLNMEKHNTLPADKVDALKVEKQRREEELAAAEKKMTEQAAQKLNEQAPSGKEAESKARRKSDKPGTVSFNTEHVQVMVAPDASREELMRVAMELLQFAETVSLAEA